MDVKMKTHKHTALTWHKDIIHARKLLARMRYYTKVCYHGPLIMMPYIKLGQDYEFYDPYYQDWDSPRAIIPHSATRKLMDQIIKLLEKHQVPRGFTLTKWTWYINR